MDAVAFARILGVESTLREQHGVIRRDQAIAAGMTRIRVDALVRQGRWVRVLPRAYAAGSDCSTVAGAAVDERWHGLAPRARIHACHLGAGEDSIIAGEAAAWWHGLCRDPPKIIAVLVPPNRRLTPHPGIQVIRARVDRPEVREVNWVRVTSPSRTCLDLARVAAPDRLVDALRLRKVDAAAIERSLERGHGRRRAGARTKGGRAGRDESLESG